MNFPNLWAYAHQLYQLLDETETVTMDDIYYHCFANHRSINPIGIAPKGPEIDFILAHERGRIS